MKSASLEQMMSDMSNGVYDLTCNGECTQCGNCCSNILPMTEDEITTIHKHIKKHHIKEHRHNYPTATPTMDMTCPFLNDDKSKENARFIQLDQGFAESLSAIRVKDHRLMIGITN